MYSRVPPFYGSTSRWRGVSFKLKCHKWPHPILRWTLPKSSVHLPLLISFWTEIESLTTILRHNPQKDWELPSDHKRSQPPQRASRVQRPKSNKLTNFHFHESSWRAHWCTKCKRQEHKCSNPPLSNSNKATNAYGGIREEEQRGEPHKNSKN